MSGEVSAGARVQAIGSLGPILHGLYCLYLALHSFAAHAVSTGNHQRMIVSELRESQGTSKSFSSLCENILERGTTPKVLSFVGP